MIDKLKKLFFKITKPSGVSLCVSILITVFIAVSTPLLLAGDLQNSSLAPLVYCCFAISAIGLAYVVCVIVFWAPNVKRDVSAFMEKRDFTRKLVKNWGYRTVFSSTVTFGITLVNSAFNAYLGISERSIWFGALAAYYIFLALIRSGLLIYHRKRRDFESAAMIRARKYTNCGILMLILNAALSSAIAQMIFDDRSFEYKDWLIYAFAAYAFYKVIMSVINAVRAQKQEDLTLVAIREINMVDGAVSILALQTALLHTFGDGSVDISLFNTLTGCVVSLFSISLSIYMIIKGTKVKKEIKNKNAGKQ